MARPKRVQAGCPDEASVQAMKRIGGRWKILIVRYLLQSKEAGFNELERVLDGVSAKMLSQQLRELQDDGIVLRHELVSEPPKVVRYELTSLGRSLEPVVDELAKWGQRALSA